MRRAGRGPCIGIFGSFWVPLRPVRASRFGLPVPGPAGSLHLDEEKQSILNFPVEAGAKKTSLCSATAKSFWMSRRPVRG